MTGEPAGQLLTPIDEEAPRRVARLQELGLGGRPDPEFDEFARALAAETGTPFAWVNFIDETRQYLAGLHPPADDPATGSGQMPRAPGGLANPGRVMARDHGWCPLVVVRRLPLVIDDVRDYPRFAGNPVVDEIGIRSYLGAPLIDRTDTALGTICLADREPRPWGRPGLEFIKGKAAELMDRIHERERQHSQ